MRNNDSRKNIVSVSMPRWKIHLYFYACAIKGWGEEGRSASIWTRVYAFPNARVVWSVQFIRRTSAEMKLTNRGHCKYRKNDPQNEHGRAYFSFFFFFFNRENLSYRLMVANNREIVDKLSEFRTEFCHARTCFSSPFLFPSYLPIFSSHLFSEIETRKGKRDNDQIAGQTMLT